MKRTFISIAAICIFGLSFSLFAQGPQPNHNDDPVVRKLDQILERLKSIEDRLKRLESDRNGSSDFTIDGQGVIKMPDGRSVGIWGIDGRPRHANPLQDSR